MQLPQAASAWMRVAEDDNGGLMQGQPHGCHAETNSTMHCTMLTLSILSCQRASPVGSKAKVLSDEGDSVAVLCALLPHIQLHQTQPKAHHLHINTQLKTLHPGPMNAVLIMSRSRSSIHAGCESHVLAEAVLPLRCRRCLDALCSAYAISPSPTLIESNPQHGLCLPV